MLRTHGCFAKNCGDVTARILLILSLALFSIAANADTIDLSKLSQKNFNVKQHLYYMELGEQLLTTAQIPGVSDSQFLSNKLTPYSPDLGASALYRLNLFNDTKRQRRLTVHIDNPMIDRLELVFVVNNAVVKRELLGDKQQPEFALKSSLPHFTFELAPQQSGKVYIQASSQGSTLFPLSLYDDTEFQTRVYQSFLTWGAFIGVILMITAYNILLLIGIKNKIYLFYLGYILSMLIQLGTVYGYGFHLFPYSIQSVLQSKIVAINYVISVFAILFALFFLRFNKHKSRLYQFSLLLCGVLTILGIASLFMPEYLAAKIYFPVQLFVYLVIARICIPKLFDGQRWTNYYLFSWLPLFIGTTVAQLVLLNLVPYNYWTQNALLFGVVIEIAIISLALAERYRAKESERIYNVTHDSVTNLPNKILLTECISMQMYQHQSFTLILFRAEKFGEIKPALGLIAANNLVTAIVDNVVDYFSAMDNLYVFEKDKDKNDIRLSRINDDTFGLLLLGKHEQEALSYIILTIQEAVSTPINVGGYSVSTSCAVGTVSFPDFGINADMVLQKAMHSLDLATKETGKYAFYSNDNNVEIQEQLQLVADLQKAIDNDQLEMYHQVQIDLASQTVCGNEALVRWHHPSKGFINPELFVNLAESTGLIGQLTEWVISKSLEQHKNILDAGFEQNISINLSAKDLTQSGLIAHIMTTIADLDLDPSTIIFELTESATSDDPVHALNTINQLHELGLKVAIDDFGTGYSSLEYLSKLPFHELKVDKSFVLDIIEKERNQAITKTTIEMAKNLGIFVVAEGIESEAIENLLRTYGCEIGQGYFYSKPLTLTAYKQWLSGDNKYARHYKKESKADYEVPLKAVY